MPALMELIDRYANAVAAVWATGEREGEPEELAAKAHADELRDEIEHRVTEVRDLLSEPSARAAYLCASWTWHE